MRRIAPGILIALLAACSGSSSKAAPATSAAAPATVATTSTQPTASVQQVASVVAEHGQAIVKELATVDTDCDPTALRQDGTGLLKITCNIDVMTVSPLSSILVTDLSKVKPPAEVQSLVAETIADARALDKAAKAVSDAKCGGYGYFASGGADPNGCTVKQFDLMTATSTMRDKLNAWAPYL